MSRAVGGEEGQRVLIWVTALLVTQDVFLDSIQVFITCCLLLIPANTLGKEAKGNLCRNEKIVSLSVFYIRSKNRGIFYSNWECWEFFLNMVSSVSKAVSGL